MIFCPAGAALILVHRGGEAGGVSWFLKSLFDFRAIPNRFWYIPVVGYVPLALLVSYGLMDLLGIPLPVTNFSYASMAAFVLIFFISALVEEAGWTGYVSTPMLERWNALETGVLLGLVWSVWHFPPWVASHSFGWALGQAFASVMLRILMVWLYGKTGQSVMAMTLFHTMINVGEFSFPNYGSHYDPAIFGMVTAVVVVVVLLVGRGKWLRTPKGVPNSAP